MNPIYNVMLDNHVVKSTFDYAEAKGEYRAWVDYMKKHSVKYNAVTVTKDQEIQLEYQR